MTIDLSIPRNNAGREGGRDAACFSLFQPAFDVDDTRYYHIIVIILRGAGGGEG